MNTTMNTGAASLSDERERAAITACALMIKGICLTRPNAEWTGAIEDRIQFMLKQMQADATPIEDDAWESYLAEQKLIIGMPGLHAKPSFIAGYRAAIAAGGAQEAIYQVMVGEKWVDSTAAEYAAVSNEKRIVYAAPLHRVAATENEALSLLRGWYEANAKGTVMVEDAAYRLVTETAALLAAASNGEQA